MQTRDPSTVIKLPAFCLVVMVGVSGSGKSTFTRRHFLASQILSSDSFRGLVSDDVNDQSATDDAFECLYCVLQKRLARGRSTVIDATNLCPLDRKGFVQIAGRFSCPVIAVVLNLPVSECLARNSLRSYRNLGLEILNLQAENLRVHLATLEQEGFHQVYVLSNPQQIEEARFVQGAADSYLA